MEQEINSNTVNKYVNSLSKLSICTGKLDSLLLYIQDKNIEDKFLLSSLDSILKDILEINGNKQYIRMSLGSHNISSEVNFGCQTSLIEQSSTPKCKIEPQHEYKHQEGVLNTKQVQTIGKKISQPLKAIVGVSDNKKTEYTFKNSTNLKSLSYTNIIKVRITFQNGRIYDYLNVPEDRIKTLITCDKNNISPGRYFNSEIRGQYEYREVTHDYEVIG